MIVQQHLALRVHGQQSRKSYVVLGRCVARVHFERQRNVLPRVARMLEVLMSSTCSIQVDSMSGPTAMDQPPTDLVEQRMVHLGHGRSANMVRHTIQSRVQTAAERCCVAPRGTNQTVQTAKDRMQHYVHFLGSKHAVSAVRRCTPLRSQR